SFLDRFVLLCVDLWPPQLSTRRGRGADYLFSSRAFATRASLFVDFGFPRLAIASCERSPRATPGVACRSDRVGAAVGLPRAAAGISECLSPAGFLPMFAGRELPHGNYPALGH